MSETVDETIHKTMMKLILGTVKKFNERHTCEDIEDAIGIAQIAFVEAMETFKADSKMRISSWAFSKIWWALLQEKRKRINRSKKLCRVYVDLENIMERKPTFCIERFLKNLTRESAAVVKLAMSIDKSKRPRQQKLSDYIRRQILLTLERKGMNNDQIEETFQEIREALAA